MNGPDISSLAPEATPDFDGDGRLDLAIEEDGGGRVHVIPSGTPLSIAADLPSVRLTYDSTFASETTSSLPAILGGTGDFDGDGFDDLLFMETNSEPPYANVWIVPGFDVPWGDTSRW